MTEPPVPHDTRAAYDAVAALYAELFSNVLEALPMERALLAAFAELVQAHNAGPVADIGCGPGHVTAHLHALGPTTFGIDLSPEMVALARRTHPGLRFDEGSMTALDLADGVLGGILASYSIIHMPPQQLPAVFTEFHRVMAPGGHLLLGFFAGDDPQPQEFDHKVTLAYRWSPDSLAELLRPSGFAEVARLRREPHQNERFQHAHLLARKRSTSLLDETVLSARGPARALLPHYPTVSRYLATSSAGTRPRSLISWPFSRAQARMATVSTELGRRPGRPAVALRAEPPTLRAWVM